MQVIPEGYATQSNADSVVISTFSVESDAVELVLRAVQAENLQLSLPAGGVHERVS